MKIKFACMLAAIALLAFSQTARANDNYELVTGAGTDTSSNPFSVSIVLDLTAGTGQLVGPLWGFDIGGITGTVTDNGVADNVTGLFLDPSVFTAQNMLVTAPMVGLDYNGVAFSTASGLNMNIYSLNGLGIGVTPQYYLSIAGGSSYNPGDKFDSLTFSPTTAPSVPDSGGTMMLLGIAAVGLVVSSRMLPRQKAGVLA